MLSRLCSIALRIQKGLSQAKVPFVPDTFSFLHPSTSLIIALPAITAGEAVLFLTFVAAPAVRHKAFQHQLLKPDQ